jgi:hypothetical protein
MRWNYEGKVFKNKTKLIEFLESEVRNGAGINTKVFRVRSPYKPEMQIMTYTYYKQYKIRVSVDGNVRIEFLGDYRVLNPSSRPPNLTLDQILSSDKNYIHCGSNDFITLSDEDKIKFCDIKCSIEDKCSSYHSIKARIESEQQQVIEQHDDEISTIEGKIKDIEEAICVLSGMGDEYSIGSLERGDSIQASIDMTHEHLQEELEELEKKLEDIQEDN